LFSFDFAADRSIRFENIPARSRKSTLNFEVTLMRIHLRNIAILIISLIIGFLLLRHGRAIHDIFNHFERIGGGHSTEEQLSAALALGFITAGAVAIIRLLTNPRPDNRRGPRRHRWDDPED
jgi:hypothetical protein